jgi:alkanesulfonate monooxygenase SsuD/methylene tetrahydromethanopterin reductase-like flavin-dependent oxidoreductase (luciferase family)
MRKLWTGEAITHQGRHFQMSNLQMLPTPARANGPPIWCGGRSEAALKRAGARLEGWVSYVVTPTMYAQSLKTIEKHYALANRNLASFGTAHLVYLRLAKDWDSAFDIASQRLSERYAMDFGPATKKYVALGRPEDIAETLHAFHVAGVRHIEIDFIGSEAEKDTQMRWFSEEVRPLLDFP